MKLILPTLISFILLACSGSPTQVDTIGFEDTTLQIVDTLVKFPVTQENGLDSVSDQPINRMDTLTETNLAENKALEHYLDYLHEEMKWIPNPVRATYKGTDFGDYFHLTFISDQGHYLDFADGNNNFGEYELYDSITFDEKKRYVGKTFDIYWEYKKAQFLCCEGEMEVVVAKTPSITNLLLVD